MANPAFDVREEKNIALPEYDRHLADLLSRATLAFLRHGDLASMAQTLLQAAHDKLLADGGLIFDFDPRGQPRLLAAIAGSWNRNLAPDPADPDAWLGGFPQPFLRLPLERGETLLYGEPPAIGTLGQPMPHTIYSMLAIPLENEGTAIGSVFLFNRPQGFNAESCRNAENLAHAIGLAIAAARERLMRQQTETELRQAQKMEALGQLAAGVAHDFNNMLTVINGYVSLVHRSLPEDDEHRQELDIALEAGRRAADLARQLLAFSRRQMLQPQVIDLNDHLDRLQKLLRRLIREDIRFQVKLTSGLPYIKVDPGQLEQILMNLVINARDAMPQGGELCISTGTRVFDPAFVKQHPGARPGHYVWFSVRDSGAGIAPEDLDRVFQPFFTTKEKGKGTGLGLATVYGIVKQSGGYITVDSQQGAGTTFTVYLPATSEGPRDDTRPDLPAIRSIRGRILLVEDDRDVLHYATRALLAHGLEVTPAQDVQLAIDLFSDDPQGFCLLVTDMVMPTLSGPLLAKRLRRIRPDLPVLFLSGYGQVTFENDFLQGEKGAYLAKPFTSEGLVRKIGEALAARQAGNGDMPDRQ
ncbi:signal transduction histidine kinase [Geothermobacter ehrlichii]|uniref:histidine kinase n=1 Tax=Geothermobacter ehrlichii TaxID=213224 RepID=A0A5D3WGF3_9BACT|nr:ATP-binding protein [Geothermobacter ehrlichii]TYO95457.1 signal transduction histidine kinase [Geothermobacter ehrlichii]